MIALLFILIQSTIVRPEILIFILIPFVWICIECLICLFYIRKRITRFADLMKFHKGIQLNEENIHWMVREIESSY